MDELKMAHRHVQQTHKSIPVFGGEAIVHLNPDGSLFAVTDDLIPGVEVEVSPRFDARSAEELAVEVSGHEGHLTAPPKSDLWILRHEGKDRLVWRVQLRREDGSDETSLPVLFLDAHTGDVVLRYDNLQTGSGSSLYSGTVSFGTYFRSSNSTYYLEDTTKKVGTFDNRNTTTSTYRFTDANDVWDSASQRAGVDAHWGAGKFIDYLKSGCPNSVPCRNGIDGSGGPGYYASIDGVTPLISSKVHYGTNFNDAFWNGSFMTYGDGDGTTFSPLVSIDIVGHEMTHGVTERTAGLVYLRESGALNESMSDVFGTLLERYAKPTVWNWKVGEACYTPAVSGDALRHMNDPHAGSQPDDYSEINLSVLNASVCDQSNDYCGVHTNSGVANKAFYLLAAGGNHHLGGSVHLGGKVSGIGATDAGKIWYKALTTYMTSSTDLRKARTATLNAASALFGSSLTSSRYSSTCSAWAAVGISCAAVQSRRVVRDLDRRLAVFIGETDGDIKYRRQTCPGCGFGGWVNLAGGMYGNPTAAVNPDGTLHAFAIKTDGKIYQRKETSRGSNQWGSWTSLGAPPNLSFYAYPYDNDPVVGENADGRLQIFAIASDWAVWTRWKQVDGTWSPGWTSLGNGNFTHYNGRPVLARNMDGRLELFVRARVVDGCQSLWHIWQLNPDGGWSSWANLGGCVRYDGLAVVPDSWGRLVAFVAGTDGGTYVNHQVNRNDSVNWSGYAGLGGIAVDFPTAGRNADGRLEVFVRGTDNSLYHKYELGVTQNHTDPTQWSNWQSLGRPPNLQNASAPDVAANLDGRLEAFDCVSDYALWHLWQTCPQAECSWSAWEKLGGTLETF